MKVNMHGLAAFLTSALGIALSPAVMGVLPTKAAAVVAGVGVIYQAFTKPAAEAAPTNSSTTTPAAP